MIKFSKKTLFFLMVLMCIMGGITLSMVDWEVFNDGAGIDIYREIDLPLIFLGLAFGFMFPYVKKLKEEEKSN